MPLCGFVVTIRGHCADLAISSTIELANLHSHRRAGAASWQCAGWP